MCHATNKKKRPNVEFSKLSAGHTAKAGYGKFEANIPINETARPQSPIPTFMFL
jgi:hypothetical protein